MIKFPMFKVIFQQYFHEKQSTPSYYIIYPCTVVGTYIYILFLRRYIEIFTKFTSVMCSKLMHALHITRNNPSIETDTASINKHGSKY